MRVPVFLLVVSGVLYGSEAGSITLPVAGSAKASKAKDGDVPVVSVSLTKLGELRYHPPAAKLFTAQRKKYAGRGITLGGVRAALVETRDLYHAFQTRIGKSGLEPVQGDRPVSVLPVVLRVDKDAPWQQVRWLLLAVDDARFRKVSFAAKPKADADPALIRAFYPAGTKPIPNGPPPDVMVAPVHVFARKLEALARGPTGARVMVPTKIAYRLASGIKASGVDEVGTYARKAKKTAVATRQQCRGEIKASNHVPFKDVVAVLDRLRGGGVTDVAFCFGGLPPKAALKAPRLPYPRAAYGD